MNDEKEITLSDVLVKQTEKPYEPHVPDWDDWDPPEYVGGFKKGEIVGYHCRNDEIERLQKEIDSQGGLRPPMALISLARTLFSPKTPRRQDAKTLRR